MSKYKERVEAGLCGKCGKPREDSQKNKSLCLEHQEKERLRAEKKRERAAASGNCPSCGVRPIAAGRKKCEICLDSSRRSTKKTADRRRQNNLCPVCGDPAMPGKTICETCSKRMTKKSADRYHARREAGKCSYCDNDPEPGSTMCAYHIQQTRNSRDNLKREVMEAYGGAHCSDPDCSETDLRFLEVDHIGGGGRQHVQEIGNLGGHALYQWLKRNNFPPGFRVLCRVCNAKDHVERCRQNGRRTTAKHEPTTTEEPVT